MQTFELLVDNKVTVWRRDTVVIEAESLEDALKAADSGEYDTVQDTEYLYETEEYMTPEDNDGYMTCEVMNLKGETIWDNARQLC